MSEIREHETSDPHDSSNPNTPTGLIGRESQVVPGRFGEPLQVTHVQYSRGVAMRLHDARCSSVCTAGVPMRPIWQT